MVGSYFNIHNHTSYSNALLGFPDVICSVQDLIQRAYDLGLSGISISEHEGLSSHIQALKYYSSMSHDRPFTLVLGNEIYLMEEEWDKVNREQHNTYPYYHFVLTALDTEGHKQLRKLSTKAWRRSWRQGKIYRRPTYYTDLEEIIGENQGHIIASTACLGSYMDKLLLSGQWEKAVDECGELDRLLNIFGTDNVYLEIQPARDKTCDQYIVNNLMWDAHKFRDVKIIPSCDSHYLSKDDAWIHKIYLQSQEGDREVEDFYATAYLMSPDELRKHLRLNFSDSQIDQMFEWSNEITGRIQGYDLFHKPIIPQIPVEKLPAFATQHWYCNWYDKYPNFAYYSQPERPQHEQYFFHQIELGLRDKVENKGKDIETYIKRLDEEFEQFRLIGEQLDTSIPCYFSSMSKIIDLIWEAGSLAMPARGSSGACLTNYLLEVTQIDPVEVGEDYLPFWRFMNKDRGVELPDIDNDSEASKKKQIVNKMKEYFGEDKVLNVATFSKISSKTAIERVCKGMNINSDTAGYIKSLIPINRGKVAKIKDCVSGKDKVPELIREFNKYPGLQDACLALEGLITNRGTHAAGVIVCNEPYTNYIAAMRSADGTMTTCYDLWDAEEAGCIKFDMLTVEAADKIHRTMDYLLEYGKIKWQGSLKATYYKYIHPMVLEYKNKDMWDILPSIYSIFQFDTPISAKALSATRPQSAMDLSAANSLLRLMPDNADETPIDKYQRYKESHDAWVEDTKNYGLNDDERAILWEYLADAYGLADSQEKIMRLSMDSRVSGYSLKESNKLRKSIARKDERLQAEAKAQFFEYGQKLGTRDVFLDYVWNVVFGSSFGYSFSQIHSYAYSIIALQELNLNYFYPKVYWNCACLSVEASGLSTNADKQSSKNYGEIAKAIYKMKKSNINILPPSINKSSNDFTPEESTNSILFALSGVSGINQDITQQIISNRPYSSFKDFFDKNTFDGTLITKSKFISLIKAGCFDEFGKGRNDTMKEYIKLLTQIPSKLTMANLPKALEMKVHVPRELIVPYRFLKYVCSPKFFYSKHPNFKSKKIYWLDDKAQRYFIKNCQDGLEEGIDWFREEDKMLVIDKNIEKFFKPTLNQLQSYINSDEFRTDYTKRLYQATYNELVKNNNVNHWSLETCSYYSNEHELANIDKEQYLIDSFNDLPLTPVFVTKKIRGREWNQYELSRIAGVVLDRNDAHHTLTVLDSDNTVVQVKFNSQAYSFFKQQISEDGKVVDPSWFKRGTLLILTGYRFGDNDFRVKRYKSSIFRQEVMKITNIDNDTGELDIQSYRYGFEDNE